ncbi:hypothetical protein WV31_10020 [Magnetospirillum sp. ME-1]|uniref:DUF3846 domain-containing protein n=1 Tax=Magnetospirillum sp. ME-1 TaxID=1639348 RepID=UPI000A17AC47|nr:hypothetical protein [Magnetospirillum sp. ME-1]ARJ65964.1 hypothetical protein WV31_10020 [Magnetospirillum sp. ME-1]
MRVLIIDPVKEEVREGEIDPANTLAGMQKIVEGLICRAHIDEASGDEIYVNDEGLFVEEQSFFSVEGGHQPFAGCGVVVRYDEDGNTQGTNTPVADLARRITWHGMNPPLPGDDEDPLRLRFLMR